MIQRILVWLVVLIAFVVGLTAFLYAVGTTLFPVPDMSSPAAVPTVEAAKVEKRPPAARKGSSPAPAGRAPTTVSPDAGVRGPSPAASPLAVFVNMEAAYGLPSYPGARQVSFSPCDMARAGPPAAPGPGILRLETPDGFDEVLGHYERAARWTQRASSAQPGSRMATLTVIRESGPCTLQIVEQEGKTLFYVVTGPESLPQPRED